MSVQPEPSQASSSRGAPPLLLAEALGFSHQLLLDDIVNTANNVVTDGINGIEAFLERWADERSATPGTAITQDAISLEIEQGMIAFQTLLEHRTDLAFDSLELWCLRNIFAVRPNLPVVLPHHAGLDLASATPAREQELMSEADELRAQIKEQRALQRELTKATRVLSSRKTLSTARQERVRMLDTPALNSYASLPPSLLAMFNAISKLPEPAFTMGQLQLADPGKRKWETGKVGYLSWAVEQLLARREQKSDDHPATDASEMTRREEDVATTEQLKQFLTVVKLADGMRKSLGGHSSQMEQEMDTA